MWFGVLPSGAPFGDPGLRRQAGSRFLYAVSFLREKGATVFCDISIDAEEQSPAQRRGQNLLRGELGEMALTGRGETTQSPGAAAHLLTFSTPTPSIAAVSTPGDVGGLAHAALAPVVEVSEVVVVDALSPPTHTPRGAAAGRALTKKKKLRKDPNPPETSSSEPDDSGGDDDDDADAAGDDGGDDSEARKDKSKVRKDEDEGRKKDGKGKKDQPPPQKTAKKQKKKEKKKKKKKKGGSDSSSSSSSDSSSDDGSSSSSSSSDDDDDSSGGSSSSGGSDGKIGDRRRRRRPSAPGRREDQGKLLRRLQAQLDKNKAREREADGKLPKFHGSKGLGDFGFRMTLDGNKLRRHSRPGNALHVVVCNYTGCSGDPYMQKWVGRAIPLRLRLDVDPQGLGA